MIGNGSYMVHTLASLAMYFSVTGRAKGRKVAARIVVRVAVDMMHVPSPSRATGPYAKETANRLLG